MDTDFKVTAADASPPESVNAGRNEVAVVTSLRDAANMGAKEMSVDESHRSEAVTPLQAPELTVGCSKPIIDIIDDLIFLVFIRFREDIIMLGSRCTGSIDVIRLVLVMRFT